MGGGKSRRHTAKTGDKSLYNNREQLSHIVERNNHSKFDKKHNSDDIIYDEVDQFHNNDYLRLDHTMDDDSDSDDDVMAEEEVMRLENDEDDDDDDDDEEEEDDSQDDEEEEEEEEEPIISSSDDDDEEDDDNDEIRDWGTKKTAYYYGDTADLEIGQEVEEALLEEDAAKDVLHARYQDMTEDDFMMDDDDGDNHQNINDHPNDFINDTGTDGSKGGITTKALSALNMPLSRLLQLSTKEKRQLLNQTHHQEFIPLLSYFTQKMILPYTNTTRKATNAIFYSDAKDADDAENTADSIGATKLGQQYLLSKAMIQSSAALNLVMYLLLKAEQAANAGTNMVDPALIQSHPVMQHLEKLNSLHSKIEEGVENRVNGLVDQLETLAKAADYLCDPTSQRENEDSESDDENDSDSEDDVENADMESDIIDPKNADTSNTIKDSVATSESDSDDDVDLSADEDAARRITLNEARFGLRPNEIQNLRQANTTAERRRKTMIQSDAGDDDIEDDTQRKKSGQLLATTLNTIEQRTSTNQKRSKRSSQQLVEHIDDPNDEDGDGELRRGLAMMEEALGAPSDDDEARDEQYDPELDEHDDYDNGGDDFYSKMLKKSKATKDERKQRYAVAPKFPRVENDIVGDRAASKQILKNRGLVAHKAKINRNPRVKHREKFRKAKIRRGGAVQAIRSPSEGHRYGGEATGISTNVVRSRKLG